MQVNTNDQIQVQIFTYLLHQTRWRRNLKSIIFKSATKFPTTNSLSAKTRKSIGNSNNNGQLKSINNNSDNYSRSTLIATAIRNGRSYPTTSGGRIDQPTTMEADNQRQSPARNDQHASTTYGNRKSAYLLIIDSLAFTFKMADNIDNQIIIGK